MKQYDETIQMITSLTKDITYDMTILANTSALLNEVLDNINWVGFYINQKNTLFLGPFQGKVACTQIPFSKGVCGACATTLQPIIVPNVHQFKGHIACDSASMSEICIPVLVHNHLYAILDIDSPIENRFSTTDLQFLKKVVDIISKQLEQIL